MQTELIKSLQGTDDGAVLEAELRKCVHCGFCNSTCPTYQLLGDELDGPRGRIYLIKQMAEGATVSATTRQHLDRCLTCRACETTCPSGVAYARLSQVGRDLVERAAPRPQRQRVARQLLLRLMLSAKPFALLLFLGRLARPLLPAALKQKIPRGQDAGVTPPVHHPRKVLLLEGCVQPAMLPNINAATARVLDRIGYSTVRVAQAACCGALRLHNDDKDAALNDIRRSIDAWWPWLENGVRTIVVNASGCGVTVKEWGHLLRADPAYANKARIIADRTQDLSEFLASQKQALAQVMGTLAEKRLAFHAPCTLQHGQKLPGITEDLLRDLGFAPSTPTDAHLCCGSAGTYSIFQPALSARLRRDKLERLDQLQAPVIASANIGCIAHLQRDGKPRVRHWIELIDAALSPAECGSAKEPFASAKGSQAPDYSAGTRLKHTSTGAASGRSLVSKS